MSKYRSRKFIIAAFFAVTGAIGFFMSLMDGGTFVAMATVVTGLYAGADVMEKRNVD